MGSGRFAWGEALFRLFLGEASWRAGQNASARRTLEEVVDLAERCGMKFPLGSAHRLLGEVVLSTAPIQGDESLRAAHHFEKSIAILRAINAENELALAYAGYGRLHRRLRKIAEARTYLSRALEILERLGTLIEPERVKGELAELPG